jgi:hypothetical protein
LGISRVQFQVASGTARAAVIGTAVFTHGFWALSWNTNEVPNGTYVVRSVAYNAAGDRSVSKGVTIRVAN